MHVLYVNHTSRISGGELSLITLLRALPADLRAAVACPEGPLAELLRGEGIAVVPLRGTDGSLRLHPIRTARALGEMAQAALQVREAARTVDADLVHANSIRAGLVAIACGRPTVVHVRDCLPPGPISSLALRAIGRADALIANSAYTRSTLGARGKDANVIHNAVDLTRFEPPRPGRQEARRWLGLGADDGPVLAVVAQITPWKGQDDAIEIARRLLPAHPRLKLLLVGSPKFDSASTRYDNAAFLAALRRQAAAPELGGAVRFLGERDDVPEVLGAVDLLLAPSWEEPFGRTLVEAMAAGVPVVATDVGGPPEIVAKAGSGVVLPPRRPELWADVLAGLLSDPDRLEEMATRGRDAARAEFGAERHAREVVKVYESVLASSSSALVGLGQGDLGAKATLEGRLREGGRVSGDHRRIEALEVRFSESGGEGTDVVRGDQHPGLAVEHGLQRPARRHRHHRRPRRLRLHRGDAELLDVGHDEGTAAGVQLGQLLVVDPAEEPARPADSAVFGFEPFAVRAVADHADRRPDPPRGLEGQIDPLVADQLGDDQEVGPHRAGPPKPLDLDRGVDDRGRPHPVVGDPLAGDLGVGDIAADPSRGDPVPLPDLPEREAESGPQRRRDLPRGTLPLEPGIAKRAVAVADVNGTRARPDGVGEGAAARDHEVEPVERQRAHRPREDGQERAEAPLGQAEALQVRSAHLAPGEAPLGALDVVEQGVDRRFGPAVRDRLEGALGAASDQQVIVDEGDGALQSETSSWKESAIESRR